MPRKEVLTMVQRREFVELAMHEGVNRRELCRRFGISSKVGYKWFGRFAADGERVDRSHRPHTIPLRTDRAIEEHILAVRDAHPGVGGSQDCAMSFARGNERAGDFDGS
jgi:putative transposase